MAKTNKVLKSGFMRLMFVMGVLTSIMQTTALCADIIVNSSAKINLPLAGTAGRLYRVADDVRGLWMDQGSQWFSLSGEVINVKDFGAKGDGITNDATAIQDAINALPSAGGTVLFPPGKYLVNTTLVVDNLRSVSIVGAGLTNDVVNQNKGTIIKWNGGAAAVLKVTNSRHIRFFNFSIDGNTKTATMGIQLTSPLATDVVTLIWLNHLHVEAAQIGIAIGSSGDAGDVDIIELNNIRLIGNNIGTQQIGSTLENIQYLNVEYAYSSTRGMDIVNGSAFLTHANFATNGTECIKVSGGARELCASNVFAETNSKFLNLDVTSEALPSASFSGLRIASGQVAGSDMISVVSPWRLVLLGANLTSGNAVNITAASGARILELGGRRSNNVSFPARASFIGQIQDGLGLLDGAGFRGTGSTVTSPTFVIESVEPGTGFYRSEVNQIGIARNGVNTVNFGANIRGAVTISNTSSSGTVTFGTAEMDTNYFLTVTPTGVTGSPAAGSNRIKSISKTTTGFTITLEASPGSGNSRTFDWHLLR